MAENYPKEEDDAEPAGIDVSRLVRQLWAGRLTVSATTALALLVSIVYLHTLDFAYSASLTLVPTQNQQQGGLGNQVGSLASLAGINVGSAQGSSPFIVYPDTLTSRAVADEIIRRAPAVMRRIYRYAWNDRAGRWEEPESLRGKISKIVKPLLGLPVTHWTPPDGADLQAYIAQSVQSAQDPKKPVITLSYFNPDPQFAGYFLQLVHSSTDVVLRRMTLARANDYARYLYQRLPKTEGNDMLQILVQSLSQQETIIMMGSSKTPFAAQPLGPPVVSLFPVRPRGLYILIAGVLIGMTVGGFLVLRGLTLASLWYAGIGLLRRH